MCETYNRVKETTFIWFRYNGYVFVSLVYLFMIFAPIMPTLWREATSTEQVIEEKRAPEPITVEEPIIVEKTKRELAELNIQNQNSINHMYEILVNTKYFGSEKGMEFVRQIDAFYNDVVKDVINDKILKIKNLEALFAPALYYENSSSIIFPRLSDYNIEDLSYKSNLNDLVSFFLSWVYKFLITDDYISNTIDLDGLKIVNDLDRKYNFMRITTDNSMGERDDIFKPGNPLGLKGALSRISALILVRIPKVEFLIYHEIKKLLKNYKSGFSVKDFVNTMFKKYYDIDDYYNDLGRFVDSNAEGIISPEQHVVLNYTLRYANDIYAMLVQEGANKKTDERIEYGLYLASVLLLNFISERRLEKFVETDQTIQDTLNEEMVVHTIEGKNQNYTLISINLPYVDESGRENPERKAKIDKIRKLVLTYIDNEFYKIDANRMMKEIASM